MGSPRAADPTRPSFEFRPGSAARGEQGGQTAGRGIGLGVARVAWAVAVMGTGEDREVFGVRGEGCERVRRRRRDVRCARDAWAQACLAAVHAMVQSRPSTPTLMALTTGSPGSAPGRCRPEGGQPVTAIGREVAGTKGHFPWRGTKARKRNRTPALSSSSNV